MRWERGSVDERMFTFLLRKAGIVTVLGENHRARLVALGIPGDRVRVVINSCDAGVLDPEGVRAKHAIEPDRKRPLRLLFLSSLIDTKGYPEYLEAVRRLAAWGGTAVDAVLCGRVSPSEFSEEFKDGSAAERWIEAQVAAINLFPGSRARWVRGAAGPEKAALLRDADIFVLPTRYPVEAQPVALLEAMASGCAIVTTRAGEISAILDDSCAVMIGAPDADAVEAALQSLAVNPEKRSRLAVAAHSRFVERFGVERHLDVWETILGSPPDRKGAAP